MHVCNWKWLYGSFCSVVVNVVMFNFFGMSILRPFTLTVSMEVLAFLWIHFIHTIFIRYVLLQGSFTTSFNFS